MKVAYLHGLESKGKGVKNDLLKELFEKVYDPEIDYKKEGIWEEIYKGIETFEPDLIIGSSMGGWFALQLCKHFGTEGLLFNPALHQRSIKVKVDESGVQEVIYKVVLGKEDELIVPEETLGYLDTYDIDSECYFENHGHRTPVEVFEKYVRLAKSELKK